MSWAPLLKSSPGEGCLVGGVPGAWTGEGLVIQEAAAWARGWEEAGQDRRGLLWVPAWGSGAQQRMGGAPGGSFQAEEWGCQSLEGS